MLYNFLGNDKIVQKLNHLINLNLKLFFTYSTVLAFRSKIYNYKVYI